MTLQMGDIVTFASRPKWWKRVLLRLGIMKPKKSKEFVITWVSK